MPHSNVDEAVAQEAVDVATLIAENASLRDRLLRALADAENIRRRAERTAEEAQQYAISDFARELLMVADNLERTIAAAAERPETVEDQALIEGVRATKRLLEQTLSHFGVRKNGRPRLAIRVKRWGCDHGAARISPGGVASRSHNA
jgi:molecular chaperone GrpE